MYDRPLTIEQILTMLAATPSRLADLTEGLQGGRVYLLVWLDGQRFPAGEFFDHFHDDHEPDVRAWLARVGKQ